MSLTSDVAHEFTTIARRIVEDAIVRVSGSRLRGESAGGDIDLHVARI